MNIPNLLTFLRILLIPVMVVLFFMPHFWALSASAAVFAAASMTDWLDGYLARKLQQESPLGAFLDPVADKLIVIVALLLLVFKMDNVWVLALSGVIICREVVVSALREWMASLGKRATVKVSILGKVKTFLQMFAITFLIWAGQPLGVDVAQLGLYLLGASAVMALWSMLDYLFAARRELLS